MVTIVVCHTLEHLVSYRNRFIHWQFNNYLYVTAWCNMTSKVWRTSWPLDLSQSTVEPSKGNGKWPLNEGLSVIEHTDLQQKHHFILKQKPTTFAQKTALMSMLHYALPGLKLATDTFTNATNIFSWATKNSGLVATLVIRKQTFHLILLCFHHKNVPNSINRANLPPNLSLLLSGIFSNNQIW